MTGPEHYRAAEGYAEQAGELLEEWADLVSEGEQAPVVTSHLGLDDPLAFEGPTLGDEDTAWQVVGYNTTDRWVCDPGKADAVVVRCGKFDPWSTCRSPSPKRAHGSGVTRFRRRPRDRRR